MTTRKIEIERIIDGWLLTETLTTGAVSKWAVLTNEDPDDNRVLETIVESLELDIDRKELSKHGVCMSANDSDENFYLTPKSYDAKR